MISRVARLTVSLALLAASAALGAPPTPAEAHLLGRLGYGHDNWTRNRLATLGRAAYLDEQLHPGQLPDPELNGILATDPDLDAFRMTLPEIAATFRTTLPRRPGELLRQARYEHLVRATVGRRQLQALLTEFWFNHFNVDLGGTDLHFLVPYLRDTLRPNALGKFEDLLLAVAHSPAMLVYLDNARSFKAGFVQGGKTLGLNENYARELMELHTFGMDDQGPVYKQADVTEVARCLTGWTTDRVDGFRFLAAGHDQGTKRPLGLSIPANGGEQDGITVLRHLARHPRTALFLSRKLVTFFVGPGQTALVDRARDRWIATQGDLREVLRVILGSSELVAARDVKVKRPNLVFLTAMRSIDVDTSVQADRVRALATVGNLCAEQGLPLYQVPPPTGWADAPGTFLSEGSMLERFSALQRVFGGNNALVHGYDGNATSDAQLLTNLGDRILGTGGLTAQTRAGLAAYLAGLPATTTRQERARLITALIFSSPEFTTY